MMAVYGAMTIFWLGSQIRKYINWPYKDDKDWSDIEINTENAGALLIHH